MDEIQEQATNAYYAGLRRRVIDRLRDASETNGIDLERETPSLLDITHSACSVVADLTRPAGGSGGVASELEEMLDEISGSLSLHAQVHGLDWTPENPAWQMVIGELLASPLVMARLVDEMVEAFVQGTLLGEYEQSPWHA